MSGRQSAVRTAGALVIAVLLVVGGCSTGGAGGDTTCDQWRELSPSLDEQMSTSNPMSGKQEGIAKEMLSGNGKDGNDLNVVKVGFQVQQYCGVDGSGNWMNGDSPVSEGVQFD